MKLARMSAGRVQQWVAGGREQYVADRVAAGETRAEAEANAEASYSATFPGGVPTPSQRIFDIVVDGSEAGFLWLAPRSDGEPEHWWVFDIEIHEQFRGRGLGRLAMRQAEDVARAEGAKTLGLNVFGNNTVARRLYESLDYTEIAVQMRKPL